MSFARGIGADQEVRPVVIVTLAHNPVNHGALVDHIEYHCARLDIARRHRLDMGDVIVVENGIHARASQTQPERLARRQ